MEKSAVGLVVIIIAWLIQLAYVLKGKREINAGFLVVYMVGCAIIVVNEFTAGLGIIAWLNLGCFIAAALVLLKLCLKK